MHRHGPGKGLHVGDYEKLRLARQDWNAYASGHTAGKGLWEDHEALVKYMEILTAMIWWLIGHKNVRMSKPTTLVGQGEVELISYLDKYALRYPLGQGMLWKMKGVQIEGGSDLEDRPS
jgi:hypothetical protein